jgi:hypothetical protein
VTEPPAVSAPPPPRGAFVFTEPSVPVRRFVPIEVVAATAPFPSVCKSWKLLRGKKSLLAMLSCVVEELSVVNWPVMVEEAEAKRPPLISSLAVVVVEVSPINTWSVVVEL